VIHRSGSKWILKSEDGTGRVWARADTLAGILKRWDSLRSHMLREGAVTDAKKPLYAGSAKASMWRLELREAAVMAGDFETANIKTKRIDHSVIER
jgi:hypothetical protein